MSEQDIGIIDIKQYRTIPRSTRRTFSSPQLCTISVALLDQGEMVPGRGTTISVVPVGLLAGLSGP
jgi:hypothetical protein